MLYFVRRLGLTVVMTSDDDASATWTGHRDALHALLGEIISALGAQEAAPSTEAAPDD